MTMEMLAFLGLLAAALIVQAWLLRLAWQAGWQEGRGEALRSIPDASGHWMPSRTAPDTMTSSSVHSSADGRAGIR